MLTALDIANDNIVRLAYAGSLFKGMIDEGASSFGVRVLESSCVLLVLLSLLLKSQTTAQTLSFVDGYFRVALKTWIR